jgi:hypothetical protein
MSTAPSKQPKADMTSDADLYAKTFKVFNDEFVAFSLADWQIEKQSLEELENSLIVVDRLIEKAEGLGTVSYEVPQTDGDADSMVKQISIDASPFLFDTK